MEAMSLPQAQPPPPPEFFELCQKMQARRHVWRGSAALWFCLQVLLQQLREAHEVAVGATPHPPKPTSPGILRIPTPDDGDPTGRLIPGMADDDSLDSACLDVVTKAARQVSAFMEDEVEDAAWRRLTWIPGWCLIWLRSDSSCVISGPNLTRRF